MGLTVDYFYSLTPRQFANTLTGFRAKQDAEFKNSWEQTRQIMWAGLVPHQAKNAQLTPFKVMMFPWEKETADNTVADLEALKNEVAEKNIKIWEKYDAKKIQA